MCRHQLHTVNNQLSPSILLALTLKPSSLVISKRRWGWFMYVLFLCLSTGASSSELKPAELSQRVISKVWRTTCQQDINSKCQIKTCHVQLQTWIRAPFTEVSMASAHPHVCFSQDVTVGWCVWRWTLSPRISEQKGQSMNNNWLTWTYSRFKAISHKESRDLQKQACQNKTHD